MAKGQDRFTLGVVVGVIVLVLVALALVRLRPEPEYRTDGRPDAAAYNYLLAMQTEDWERAYTYLSPELACYPESLETFVNDVTDNRFVREFGSVELRVDEGSLEGDVALVEVQETTFYSNGLFSSGQSTNTFEVKLQRVEGEWRIERADNHWLWYWHDPGTDTTCAEHRGARGAKPPAPIRP